MYNHNTTKFSLFSKEKLELIRRGIFKLYGEDIDSELTTREIDELRQYYLDNNIHGFEPFLAVRVI